MLLAGMRRCADRCDSRPSARRPPAPRGRRPLGAVRRRRNVEEGVMNGIRFNVLASARAGSTRRGPRPLSRSAWHRGDARRGCDGDGDRGLLRLPRTPGARRNSMVVPAAARVPLIHLCAYGGSTGRTSEAGEFDDAITRPDMRHDADRDQLRQAYQRRGRPETLLDRATRLAYVMPG